MRSCVARRGEREVPVTPEGGGSSPASVLLEDAVLDLYTGRRHSCFAARAAMVPGRTRRGWARNGRRVSLRLVRVI